MAFIRTGQLNRNPWVARHALTVADYHRMGEVGILAPQERVELIDGELVALAPIGSNHAGTANSLNRMLVRTVGDSGVMAVQNLVQLDDHSEAQPYFAVLRPRPDDYRLPTPRPDEVLLVVEVADSSLNYDRAVRPSLYARHGIPEFWIVNLPSRELEVYRDPAGDHYGSVVCVGADGTAEINDLPGVVVSVASLVG